MPRRRSSPLLTGGSHGAVDGAGNATNNTTSGSLSGWCKSLKLMLFLGFFGAFYYYINLKEKASIENSGVGGKSVTVIPEARLQGKANRKFVLQPKSEFTPGIAWLMSFPNSGTSFTMTMVARASNKSFATNYADEVMAPDDEVSLSIYPRRPEGPYWAGMSGKIATPRDLPDTYVLTKTHCGSRCLNCGPDEYIEAPELFLNRCTVGHARIAPRKRRIDVEYSPTRVQKAVHLIRNPIHNIIARYHLEYRHHGYKNDTDWLKQHSNDVTGLQQYCQDYDKMYKKEDNKFFNDKVPKAPCHGEFYKWTQWHNLVHDGLALIPHEVPTLTVYYEDYTAKFNKTVTRILDFLELKQVGILREFSARSDYAGYFTMEQLQDIKKLVKRVAHKKTWEQVQHYFDDAVLK